MAFPLDELCKRVIASADPATVIPNSIVDLAGLNTYAQEQATISGKISTVNLAMLDCIAASPWGKKCFKHVDGTITMCGGMLPGEGGRYKYMRHDYALVRDADFPVCITFKCVSEGNYGALCVFRFGVRDGIFDLQTYCGSSTAPPQTPHINFGKGLMHIFGTSYRQIMMDQAEVAQSRSSMASIKLNGLWINGKWLANGDFKRKLCNISYVCRWNGTVWEVIKQKEVVLVS